MHFQPIALGLEQRHADNGSGFENGANGGSRIALRNPLKKGPGDPRAGGHFGRGQLALEPSDSDRASEKRQRLAGKRE